MFEIDFKTWLEGYEKPADLLMNPANAHKTWHEILSELVDSGGDYSSGKYGTVCIHPKWTYVIKIFKSDSYYLKFARFAYSNPKPFFPVLYGPPKKMLPFFRRDKEWTELYVVRMERLYPVKDKEMLKEIVNHYRLGADYVRAVKEGRGDSEYEQVIYPTRLERKAGQVERTVKIKHFQSVIDFVKKYPQALGVFEGIWIIQNSNLEGASDIHSQNIMQRTNGELVLTDPLWAGSNPYMDALHARNMEMDVYGDYDYDDTDYNTVIGGKYPVKKRIHKRKPKPISRDENIPF